MAGHVHGTGEPYSKNLGSSATSSLDLWTIYYEDVPPPAPFKNLFSGDDLVSELSRSAVMILHGPELFDQGDVGLLIDLLSPGRIIVAGVMARTAAEESGYKVEFNAQPPSRVIRALNDPVFLVNRGKTTETGELFGNIVASRLDDNGLVQIECSGRVIYCWNNGNEELAGSLSRLTGFRIMLLKSTIHQHPGERKIRGCIPGEPVYVNGIVIGRATADIVVIRKSGGKVESCSGLEPKIHGLEKLALHPETDLSTAWCKSGSVRSGASRRNGNAPFSGRVLVIDHCGHEIYARMPEECCGVLAIGDDTTAVSGHICAHRGIPVLGITDGDRDTIVPSGFAPRSVVVEVVGERDDDVGEEIAGKVPDIQVDWNEWVQEILAYLGKRVKVVIDTRHDA
jgi:hypothetical protein